MSDPKTGLQRDLEAVDDADAVRAGMAEPKTAEREDDDRKTGLEQDLEALDEPVSHSGADADDALRA